MQLRNLISPLLLASTAAAQLLTQGNGNLPACGRSCSVLTNAQSQCNGASSTSLQAWACFCGNVWTASGGALTTMCITSCTNPSDNTAIETWYTANCGSDNGASEHGGSGGTGTNNNAASSSAAASGTPSNTASSGVSASGVNSNDCPTNWWKCHWQWIVMVIVVAAGLLILGFGGRWLKKRHDRKQDRMSESFNAGITTRSTPMAAHNVNESQISGPVDADGRNSTSRSRDAFMPYGYGYTRSESRLGSYNNSSPLARGATPVNDLEKAGGMSSVTPEAPNKKSRRVKVRERLMGSEK